MTGNDDRCRATELRYRVECGGGGKWRGVGKSVLITGALIAAQPGGMAYGQAAERPAHCAIPLTAEEVVRSGYSDEAYGADDAMPTLPLARKQADGAGVTVAVIDTGVNPHPELPELIAGGDLIGDTDGRMDCDLHGSVVAGLIAGRGAQPGVAPGATIRLSGRPARTRKRRWVAAI